MGGRSPADARGRVVEDGRREPGRDAGRDDAREPGRDPSDMRAPGSCRSGAVWARCHGGSAGAFMPGLKRLVRSPGPAAVHSPRARECPPSLSLSSLSAMMAHQLLEAAPAATVAGAIAAGRELTDASVRQMIRRQKTKAS